MTSSNPFEAEQTEGEAPDNVVSLGEAAQSALSEFGDDGAVQEPLDGTEYLKVKFLGMSLDSLEDTIELGSMMTFTVEARCIGEGTDISKTDGHKKRFVKMDVQSVKVVE
jgi:hypothetical protein